MKQIRRRILVLCGDCLGSGFQATKNGPVKCTAPGCVNGEVEKWITEIVNDDQEAK